MALIICRECDHEINSNAKICPNCSAPQEMWPLAKFARFYLLGGFVFVALYALLISPALVGYLVSIWLLVGLALALIVYGRARRNTSDVAGVLYLLGIAWLILLLVVGIVRILD